MPFANETESGFVPTPEDHALRIEAMKRTRKNPPKRRTSARSVSKPPVSEMIAPTADRRNSIESLFVGVSFLIVVAWSLSLPSAGDDPWIRPWVIRSFGWGYLVASLVVMTFTFSRISSSKTDASDTGSLPTKTLLAVILGAGFFMRFSRFGEPAGSYWDDHLYTINTARNLLDFGEHGIMFPFGQALFPTYWAALVWRIFPGMSGIEIQRLAPLLTDLVGIWLMYLVGKELMGRRAGLYAAALSAVAKPMVLSTVSGLTAMYVFPFMAATLLFLLRWTRNPELRYSLGLGMVTAAGLYTYNAYRPMFLFVLFWTFSMIVMRSIREKAPFETHLLAIVVAVYLGFVFIYRHEYLKVDGSTAGKALVFALLAVLLAGYRTLQDSRIHEVSRRILHWVAGMLLLYGLSSPLVHHPQFAAHIRSASLFKGVGSEISGSGLVSLLADRVMLSLRCLFIGVHDRSDMNLPDHAMLEFMLAALVLLGIPALLALRNWRSWLLAGLFATGMVPHALSTDPYSAKLVATLPVLLSVAALGMTFLTLGGTTRTGRFAWSLLLFTVMGFMAVTNHRLIYGVWFEQVRPQAMVYRAVRDHGAGKVVFLAPFHPGFYGSSIMAVMETLPSRILQSRNVLGVPPEKTCPDLLILAHPDDRLTLSRLQSCYPGASRTDETGPDGRIRMVRLVIPGLQVGSNPGDPFHRVSPGPWSRRFYGGHYGLTRGIFTADEVSDPTAPVPECSTARIEGRPFLGTPGMFEFRSRGPNYAILEIDGARVLRHRPRAGKPESSVGRIRIRTTHPQVVLTMYFQQGRSVPLVEYRRLGEGNWKNLGSADRPLQ